MKGISSLGHIGIKVKDLDKSIAFYTQTMGFPEMFRLHRDDGRAWLVYRVNCSLTPVQEAFKKKTDRKAFFPDYECSLNCALPAIFDLSLLGGSPFHEASEGPSDELELKR